MHCDRAALAAIEHFEHVLQHETLYMTIHMLAYRYHAVTFLTAPVAPAHRTKQAGAHTQDQQAFSKSLALRSTTNVSH
jgi:hypothetical protein